LFQACDLGRGNVGSRVDNIAGIPKRLLDIDSDIRQLQRCLRDEIGQPAAFVVTYPSLAGDLGTVFRLSNGIPLAFANVLAQRGVLAELARGRSGLRQEAG
jgi:hypothetical protein